jgi:1-Cys peroxiredoxin 6
MCVRPCQTIALSCDGAESHKGWIEDIKATQGISEFGYPIIADEKRELAVKFGMVDPDEKDAAGMGGGHVVCSSCASSHAH